METTTTRAWPLPQRPSLLLLLGVVLIAASQVRFPIAALAWVAAVPWLRYLRVTTGARARVVMVAAHAGAWTLATMKIASEPIFLALAPAFALPIALAQSGALLLWDRLRTRVRPGHAALLFGLSTAAAESLLYSFTELGSWGAAGYAQLDDLPLLQLASVFGLAGIAALVGSVAASIEQALAQPGAGRPLVWALGAALGVHAFGVVRLAISECAAAPRLEVAMIATDSDVRGAPLPERARTHAWDDVLHERTRRAARAGATLVVWPEAATLVWPDEEDAWLAALAATAREAAVDVVAAYVVPVADVPLRYRNEARVALADGTVLPAYGKVHPVPGEPAVAGDPDAVGGLGHDAIERPWGTLAIAVCYDYDFPAMARARAVRGVDLVAVPSSDWRGIDPVHGQMATVRAIESGHALVRSTRWGLSVASDAYGRVRAWRSHFEGGADLVLAGVPMHRAITPYSWWGELPLFGAWTFAVAMALRRR
ncbi:MAG: nitrilase-related carbon-nitrogen hydrolase [Nannocystaceae bacterium]